MSQRLEGRLSQIVRELPPSGIRRFFDLANQMEDIISLGVGEPDFVTPWRVREACFYALEQGYTTYTSNRGMPELREAIANYLHKYDLHYDPLTEIIVTIGGSEAIDIAMRTILSPGDEILIPDPGYVSYYPCAILAGATPVAVTTCASDDFKLTKEAILGKITEKTKAIMLCFPNNPTGAIMTHSDWQPIVDLILERDLFVISDEIYAELTYGEKHVSIAAFPEMKERTVVVSGMSKAFAMTGWRIGYVTGPEYLIKEMLKIHQYTIMCAPIMGQMAALEALQHGEKDKDAMIKEYDQRRRLVVEGFRSIGLPCHEPKGAFYAFPDIRNTGLTSAQFAERLLIEGKVAVVPGEVFGQSGEGFIRCSYATSVKQLETAIERIGLFLKQLDRIEA